MAEWASGNIFIRPNLVTRPGVPTQRHTHNFDHTTFATRGWWLVRGVSPDGVEVINQFSSAEYSQVRQLLQKYEPESIRRPIRRSDKIVNGYSQFQISFIGINDPVPEDATEILFNPKYAHRLIQADWEHEFVLLSAESAGEFSCVFSHRSPQGEITQNITGWLEGYQ